MIDRITNDDNDRGQVGIGTLIVFIAMVLVAAIAAGVLINTAGFLQSSAEESGEQSSAQVTNRLQVVNAVGSDIVDDSGSEVTTVELTVKKAPGADNVDLTTTTAQMVSSDGTFDVVSKTALSEGGGTTGDAAFVTSTFQDDDNSITNSNVLNDPADRAIMKLQTDSTDNLDGNLATSDRIQADLSEGSTASIKLNTQAGGETTATLVVPESLSGKSAVSL
jgi:flagellin FlaB